MVSSAASMSQARKVAADLTAELWYGISMGLQLVSSF